MSSETPNVKHNFIYRLLYEILVIITPLITMPYISRVLGADGVGIHSYANSIVTYFTLVAALGTSSYGAREIARNRENKKTCSKIFWEIELLTIMTSSICLIGWIILASLSSNYKLIFFALTPMLLATMVDISWFYTGEERIVYSVILNSLCKIIGTVFLFLFVKSKDDLVTYTLINSGVLFFGNLSMWAFLPKFLVKVDFHNLTFKTHFHETLIYFIPAVATTIYTVLDKTLINLITGSVYENGYYEQATKIVNMCKILVFSSVNVVMEARISFLFAKERYDEIRMRIARSMDYILFLGYGCVFGIIGIAGNFVPWFFGDGYEPVIPLLYVMSVLIVIIGISNCLGSQYYNPSGRRKESAVFIIIGSAVNLCLNLIMIPSLGAMGATIASIIAELTITILYVKNCRGYISLRDILCNSWKRIIAGALMCFFVIFLGRVSSMHIALTIILQVIVGIVVYAVILLIMRDSMMFYLLDEACNILRKTFRRVFIHEKQ